MDYIELAKKLKALAERGHGGEKFNADSALKALMRKYDITEEQLAETTRQWASFKFPRGKRKLYAQIASSVIGKRVLEAKVNVVKNILYLEVTKAEELELRAKFDYWNRAYDEEVEIFLDAFIQKNSLTPTDMPADNEKEKTPEERERFLKMANLYGAMEKRSFTRDLPEKIE